MQPHLDRGRRDADDVDFVMWASGVTLLVLSMTTIAATLPHYRGRRVSPVERTVSVAGREALAVNTYFRLSTPAFDLAS